MDRDSSREEEDSAADCSKESNHSNILIWNKRIRNQIRIQKSDGRETQKSDGRGVGQNSPVIEFWVSGILI